MTAVVDYSLARPTAAQLLAVGAGGVIRYIGWDCEPGFACERKNLTPQELAFLRANGFEVGLSFEYAANAALNGAIQGAADGGLADVQLARLGLALARDPMGVFYAYDFDVPDFAPRLPEGPANALAKLGPCGEYAAALRGVALTHEVAAYGGFWAVSRLLDAGLVKKAWQTTLAWSEGSRVPAGATHCVIRTDPLSGRSYLFDTRCVLRQTGGVVLGDADADALEHTGPDNDWGQYPRPGGPPPPPVPWEETLVKLLPTIAQGSANTAFVRRVQGLCAADMEPLAVDGKFGAKTKAAVEAVQSRAHIAVDGVVGPQTWAALLTGAGLAAT